MDLPDHLQEKLNDYNRNFEALNGFLGDNDMLEEGMASELRVQKTREMLTTALPVAVRTLCELAAYATSESVRLKASQYLIDRALGREGNISDEDEATKLLRRLIKSA